jgi:hypothetical protein
MLLDGLTIRTASDPEAPRVLAVFFRKGRETQALFRGSAIVNVAEDDA